MITVAIPNVSDSSEKTIQFLYQTIKQQGHKVEMFIPNKHIYYKANRKISLKQYLDLLTEKQEVDILLVELTKGAIEQEVYQKISFNIVVLFDGKRRKSETHQVKIGTRFLERIKSSYYVVPKHHNIEGRQRITYGWHKEADVSASSSQTELDGRLQIQCCMEGREFSVSSLIDDTDSILAGIATLKLYGIDLS